MPSPGAAHASPAHFARSFRRAFGETPHQYLLTRRMERAAALLRGTDHSVARICAEVGLASVGSFTTSFKRTFGETPTEYRAAGPPAGSAAPDPLVRAHGVDAAARPSSFGEDRGGCAGLASPALTHRRLEVPRWRSDSLDVGLWVHDLDDALAFYTGKLGFEIREDVTLEEFGGYRWLTVGPAGQPDVAFTLNVPGPPLFDRESADEVLRFLAQGKIRRLHPRLRRLPGDLRGADARAAWSSSSRRPSSPTASTRACATRRATQIRLVQRVAMAV